MTLIHGQCTIGNMTLKLPPYFLVLWISFSAFSWFSDHLIILLFVHVQLLDAGDWSGYGLNNSGLFPWGEISWCMNLTRQLIPIWCHIYEWSSTSAPLVCLHRMDRDSFTFTNPVLAAWSCYVLGITCDQRHIAQQIRGLSLSLACVCAVICISNYSVILYWRCFMLT